MDMGVDQAGHQGLALEVDGSCRLGLGRGDGFADLADGAALDEDADGLAPASGALPSTMRALVKRVGRSARREQ
jgi:hypothetical protein